jgi:hypothetical protein
MQGLIEALGSVAVTTVWYGKRRVQNPAFNLLLQEPMHPHLESDGNCVATGKLVRGTGTTVFWDQAQALFST